MTSQRYIDFRRFMRTMWKRIIRYWMIILAMGLLIGYVVEAIRMNYGFFAFLWLLCSLSITYLLFFIFYKPPKDLDGDY